MSWSKRANQVGVLVLTLALVASLNMPVLAWGEASQSGGGHASTAQTSTSSAPWDGTVASGYEGGEGTSNDPYRIASANQLAYFAQQVNSGVSYRDAHFKLTAALDLNNQDWAPIGSGSRSSSATGTDAYYFEGTFDGAGYAISNLNVVRNADQYGAGLFGVVKNATIKNVNVTSGTVSNSAGSAAGVVAVLIGDSGQVTDCSNGATVSGDSVGGVVGRAYASKSTVTDCSNSGAITGTRKAGGVVGINGGTTTVIEGCSNTGKVTGGSDGLGGILGYGSAGVTVSNCRNEGTIGETTYLYAGGIVGYATDGNSKVLNSKNAGIVTSSECTGGIVGLITKSWGVESSSNEGAISGLKNVGGIVGGNQSGLIKSSNNASTVSGAYAGGVVGSLGTNASIESCAGGGSAATITGTSAAGRLIGAIVSGAYAENSAFLTIDDTNGDVYGNLGTVGLMAPNSGQGYLTVKAGTFYGEPTVGENIGTLVFSGGSASWKGKTDVAGIWQHGLGSTAVWEKKTSFVAETGGTGYATFAEAVDAAEAGATVTMLADATVDATITLNKSLSINLNGKTLYSAISQARIFDVAASQVELSFDGTVPGSSMKVAEGTSKSYGFVRVLEASEGVTVTFNGGTYEGDTGGALLVRFLGGDAKLNLTNVTATSNQYFAYADVQKKIDVVISGGTFTTTNGLAFGFGSIADGSTVLCKGVTVKTNNGSGIHVFGATATFENCTFETTGTSNPAAPTTAVAVSSNGVVNIVGGTYRSNHYGLYVYSSGGTINVQNGTVSGEVAAVKEDVNLSAYPQAASVVNIMGGTITGAFMPDANSKLNIMGGTFSNDPAAYCAPGFSSVKNADNTYSIVDVREAAIGDTKYVTLKDAIKSAIDGDTITLLANIKDQGNIPVEGGKSITLDLNGNTIGFAPNAKGTKNCFSLRGASLNITGSGKIYEQGPYLAPIDVFGSPDENATNYSVLNVGENVVLEGYDGIIVSSTQDRANGVVINVAGTLSGKADSDGYGGVGLAVNGTVQGTGQNAPQITIEGTAVLRGEMGASANPQNAVSDGMYLAGYATTVIKEGASIEAGTGIEIRAGKLTVEGGTITGTATPTDIAPNGNGSTSSGAGIAVAQHSTKLPIEVVVSGGTIAGFSALYESNPQNNSSADLEKIRLAVSGGTLKTANGGKVAVYSEDKADFITGGMFNAELDTKYYDEALYSQNAQDATENPGAVVPRIYSLEYDLDGGTMPEGASNPSSYTYFDKAFTLANPVKAGYTFAGWTSVDLTGAVLEVTVPAQSTGNRSYQATWTANTDTPYKVEHYFQKVEGDEYALDGNKTQTLIGTTGKATAAAALTITGFTANAITQLTIAGDESTVVKVYYNRNIHEVSYAYEGTVPSGASTLPATQQVRYGAPVTAADAATAPGYDFSGWGVAENMTMPDKNVTLKGSFTPRGDTAYRVMHYLENLDGSYSVATQENLTGATDALVTAAPKMFVGFTLNEEAPDTVASGTIKADGSLELKLYYNLNTYEVSYAYQGDIPTDAPQPPAATTAKFNQEVTPADAPVMVGYGFSGWSKSDAFLMPAEDVVITGSWIPNTDVSYTVHYYLDGTTTKIADDKQVTGRTFQQTYAEQAPAINGYTVKGSASQNITLDSYGKELTFFYTADEARLVFESNGGSKVNDIVGRTGQLVQESLPQPTRANYAFAGWYAEKNLVTQVRNLPDTFPAGTTTYYAKWNAVPLPPETTGDVEIQVEVPVNPGDGSPHADVPQQTQKKAAEQAKSALETITNGEVPTGMDKSSADAVKDVVDSAGPDDEVSVVVAIKAEVKTEDDVDDAEKEAVQGASSEGEEVSLYLDLSVMMKVQVENQGEILNSHEVPLDEVDEPLLIEIKVDPKLIQGKSVRIAHVHDGVTEIIYPESVDYELGIIRIYASAFSTYALLTADSIQVTFESNGGTAVASQMVKYQEKALKPSDPSREGFVFAGWFVDAECTQAYDFETPVERPLTLYAKWTQAPGQKGDQGGSTTQGGSDEKTTPGTKLLDTGDATAPVTTGVAGLAVLAGVVLCAVTVRRRRS